MHRLVGIGLLASVLTSCAQEVADPPPTPATGTPTIASPTGSPSPDDFGEALIVGAAGAPAEGKAPLQVEFNVEIEGGTPPFRVTWTFGDDSPPVSAANASHTYTTPGTYKAAVTVEDGGGDSDSDRVEVSVRSAPDPPPTPRERRPAR
jgi:PKD repeat protein